MQITLIHNFTYAAWHSDSLPVHCWKNIDYLAAGFPALSAGGGQKRCTFWHHKGNTCLETQFARGRKAQRKIYFPNYANQETRPLCSAGENVSPGIHVEVTFTSLTANRYHVDGEQKILHSFKQVQETRLVNVAVQCHIPLLHNGLPHCGSRLFHFSPSPCLTDTMIAA